jgi:hypothetical protein
LLNQNTTKETLENPGNGQASRRRKGLQESKHRKGFSGRSSAKIVVFQSFPNRSTKSLSQPGFFSRFGNFSRFDSFSRFGSLDKLI